MHENKQPSDVIVDNKYMLHCQKHVVTFQELWHVEKRAIKRLRMYWNQLLKK